jgi:hypothetical protein
LAGLVVLAALAAIFLLVWKLPLLVYGDVNKASADARLQAASGFRTALIAGLAGLAALGSLIITIRTYRLTQESQITDRYTKAIEQLGSDKVEVRLGGIYALERIANDSVRDRVPVAEVLAAFIRVQAPWPPSRPGQHDEGMWRLPSLQTRAPDVQTALTVLGRREPPTSPAKPLDLRDTDLRKANLEGAQLLAANLEGARLKAGTLDNAQLQRANLTGARLQDSSLKGTQLQGANLREAKLLGAECNAKTAWPFGFDWKAAGVFLKED